MTPVSLKRFRPLVKGPDRFRVRSIQHVAAVAPHIDEAHFEQTAQLFRNRRLLQPQRTHDLPHRPFLQCKIVQDCPPPWLRHRIERIRGCRCSCHEPTLHSHMGICQVLFFLPSRRPDPVIPSITEQAGFCSPCTPVKGSACSKERNLSSSLLSAQVRASPTDSLGVCTQLCGKVFSGRPSADLHLRAKHLLNSVLYLIVRQ